MKLKFYYALLVIALLFSTTFTTTVATLGLTTDNPTLGSSSTTIDYLEFGSDGDLSSFFNTIDSSSGVTPIGLTDFSFNAAFPLAIPTIGATGFLDIFDDNGQFLSGDLFAVGFTDDVIELQFNNLIGSASGSFGNSILALITFDSPLGTNPFNSLTDGDFYTASVSISNVVSTAIFEPNILALFAIGFIGLLLYRCGSKPTMINSISQIVLNKPTQRSLNK